MTRWLGFVTMLLLLAGAGAAQKAPPGAQGQVQFGIDMAQRGLWSEALFRFRQAERLGDTRTAVLNNIAVAYEALGQFDRAQEYYKKALDRDPRNAGLKRNYSRFVEFYQSFKPDQPGAATEAAEGTSATAGGQPQGTGAVPPTPAPRMPEPSPPPDPASPADPSPPDPTSGSPTGRPSDPAFPAPSASPADPS